MEPNPSSSHNINNNNNNDNNDIHNDNDMSTPNFKPRNMKPKKMACVECRQQKSKCDAQENYPNPCTRCSKKKIPCSLQSDYKRTYKRAKFQQIEEELEELKKNLSQAGVDSLLRQLQERRFQPHELNNNDNNNNMSPTPPVLDTPPPPMVQQSVPVPSSNLPPLRSALNNSDQGQSSPLVHEPPKGYKQDYSANIGVQQKTTPGESQGPSIIRETTPLTPSNNQPNLQTNNELVVELSDEVLHCTPKQFGEIELSSQQIRELYLEFVNKYHRFLPIVDVSKGPERIYRLCPVLFWVIVSIALRHLSTDILMTLAPLLKSALAEITISPITRYLPNESDEPILNVSSVYSVQSLLLYTFWPPVTSSLSADSSWNTVGIAIFQAIRIGLNGPGTNNPASSSKEIAPILKENVQTWIACNIVSQTIATAFGFPAFVSFDSSVVGCCRPGQTSIVPTCIKQMVEISHFEDQMAKVLNSNTIDAMGLVDPTERLPLLKVLGQQLDELELKLSAEGLDDIRKFQILATRVHLLTYYFLDNSKIASFELRRGLVSLYNASLALLNHAGTTANKDPNFIKFVPGVFVLKIWQASCIVTKLIHSALSPALDIGAGRQIYIVAIQLANRASILKHDIAYRSSGIMRNMWQLFKTLRDTKSISNLDVTVRSRMAASVFFDCLWVLREQVGMIKLDPNRKQSSGENSNNEEEEEEEEYEVFNEGEEEVFESEDNGDANEAGNSQANTADPGTVTSEGSSRSAGSSHRKRPRSLSNNFNAEHAARKIIRTIPLDPEPISLKKSENDSPRGLKHLLQKQSPENSTTGEKRRASKNTKQTSNNLQTKYAMPQIPERPLSSDPRSTHENFSSEGAAPLDTEAGISGVSPTNIPSLDLSDDWTSDMLWKDVDSVMNDFGFNTDDLNKSVPGLSHTGVQPPYQPVSLFSNYNKPQDKK